MCGKSDSSTRSVPISGGQFLATMAILAISWMSPQLVSSAEWRETSSIFINPKNYSQPGPIGSPVGVSDNGCSVTIGCATCERKTRERAGRILVRSAGCGAITWDFVGEVYDSRQIISAQSDSGNVIAVGSYRRDANGSRSGEVKVFIGNPSGSSFTQRGESILGSRADEEFGRSLAMDSHGVRVAAAGHGVVRVFEFSVGGQYLQIGDSLNVPVSSSNALRMSSDGNLLAIKVGSYIHQYEWNSLTRNWSRRAPDLLGGGAGFDMSRDGNVIVVAQPAGRGHLEVFKRDVSDLTWRQLGTSSQMQGMSREELLAANSSWLKDSFYDSLKDKLQDEGLGRSVSISADGTRVAAGSTWYIEEHEIPDKGRDGGNSCTGGARAFQWNPSSNSWEVLGQGPLQSCKQNKIVVDYFMDIDIYAYASYGDDGADVDLDASGSRLIVGNTHGYKVSCLTNSANDGPCVPDGWATVYSLSDDFRPKVTVTAASTSGGQISPDGPSELAVGGTVSFQLAASEGFIIGGVGGDCPGSLSGNTFIAGPILESCAVEAQFVEPRTVIASVENGFGGSILPEGELTVAKGGGAEFLLRAEPGFAVRSVGGSCLGELIDDFFVAGPVEDDCSVIVRFAEAHSVNASAGTGGSVYPEEWAVGDGGDKEFKITPDAGKWIDTVTGSCSGELMGASYFVGPVTSDCEFNVSFRPIRDVTVTASARTGGTISPAGNQSVTEGESIAFTVTPDSGYDIKELNIGSCPGTARGNVFEAGPITEDCTVQANFSLQSHTVVAAATEGGSISPAGSQSVSHGSFVSFVAVPNDGKASADFSGSCPGTASESLSGAIFEAGPITQDCLVEATFVDAYTIKPTAGVGGAVAPDTEVSVAAAGTFEFILTPDEGFTVSGVTGTCDGQLAGNIYSVGPVSSDCSFEVAYINTVEITTTGSVEPQSAVLASGGSKGFKVIYDAAKYEWTAETDCPGYVDGKWYRAVNVTEDCHLKVSRSEIQVAVTATASAGGSVEPSIQSVALGTGATVNISADTGYELDSVTGSCPYGVYVGGRQGEYFVETVSEDCDLVVKFTESTYRVTASSTGGGTISPPGIQDVGAGAELVFTLAADSDNEILSHVDGTCVGALSDDVFVTEPIVDDCYLHAVFSNRAAPGIWRQLGGSLSGGGHTVAISGDGRVVAEGRQNRPSTNRGRAAAYSLDEGSWIRMGDGFKGPNYARESQLSLSHSGNVFALGAPNYIGVGDNEGRVRVHSFDSGVWTQLGQELFGGAASSFFGNSVALSGDGETLVVGAPGYSKNEGRVFVYRWSTDTDSWYSVGGPINDSPGTNSTFGTSVAVSYDGSRVTSGDPSRNRVVTYEWRENSQEWYQVGAALQQSDCNTAGDSVDLSESGDTVAFSSSCGSEGRVNVYRYQAEAWQQLGAPFVGDPEESLSKVSLSSNGGTLAISGPGFDNNSGRVRVFNYDASENKWSGMDRPLVGELGTKFGHDIALSGGGNRLAIGQTSPEFMMHVYYFGQPDPDEGGIVSISSGPGGEVSVNEQVAVLWGDSIIVEANPDQSHDLGEVSGSCPASVAGNVILIGPVYSECDVQINFDLVQYSVAAESSYGGSITPVGEQLVERGGSSTFELIPETGYRLRGVGGSCPGELTDLSYTVGPIADDCSVVANFEKSYTLTAEVSGNGGSISPEGIQSLAEGQSVSIEITPDPFFTFEVDGDCPGALEGKVFFVEPLIQDCELTVTFSEVSNSITPVVLQGSYSVTPDSTVYVADGGFASFEVVPNSGLLVHKTSWRTNCQKVERLSDTTWRVGPYDWGELYRDCQVEWDYVIAVTVTPSATDGGSVSPTTPQVTSYGKNLLFTASPDQGYELASWSGCPGTAGDNTFTVTVGSNDCTLVAQFAPIPDPLVSFAISPPSAGTVQSQSAQLVSNNSTSAVYQVNYGERGSFYIVPTTGWVIDEIDDQSASCGGVITDGVYTTKELTSDCAVSVEFAQVLTVTTSSDVGGSVSPEDEISVLPGAELTLSYSTEVGYEFDEVAGNCPGTLTPSTFELGPVYEDCSAVFRYSRTPSAPSEPQLLSWDAGDKQILFVVDDSEPDLYPAIYEWSARCEDPSGAIFGASSGNRLIEVNGLENGVAYRCEIFVDNGVQKVGSSNIPLITPDGEQPEEKEPPKPVVISWEAGDGEILFVVAPASAEVYPPIYEWKAECYGPNDSLYPAASKVSDSRNILVSGLQNGTAYQCHVSVNNGIGESRGDDLPLITPDGSGPEETAPPTPVISKWVAEDGEIILYFAPPTTDIYPDIVQYSAECTDPQGNTYTGRSSSASVKVQGLENDVPYSCRVFWDNGIEKVGSSVVNGITPEELAMDGLPIWMLYIITQPSEAESNPNP